jgi:hypothetical protein
MGVPICREILTARGVDYRIYTEENAPKDEVYARPVEDARQDAGADAEQAADEAAKAS